MLVVAAVALAIWSVRSHEQRTTTYRILGDVAGLRLDVGDADVEIDGGATAIEVRRLDEFSFGKPSTETREVENGTVNVVSRCPEQVVGSCRVSYRVAVPDNVPIEIETSGGTVDLAGVRASVQISTASGAITATGFCGFSLRAFSDSGNVSRSPSARRTASSCALAAATSARSCRRPLRDRRAERHRRRPHRAGSSPSRTGRSRSRR